LRQTDRPVWFVGDLDDPWATEIADATPGVSRSRRVAVLESNDWARTLTERLRAPATVVLHRAILTPEDLGRLARLRTHREPAPRVILCVGPHVRHADLERCANLVDAVIAEATAPDTIARHVLGDELARPTNGPRPRVAVVSANFELRRVLSEGCEAAGYPAVPGSGWSDVLPTGPAVWDVPVLERDWGRDLARRSRLGPVIALLGFADRALVTEARSHGASACLELPCDLADLTFVLDRIALAPFRAEPAHEIPPTPAAVRCAARGIPASDVVG
jgi:hypothetical protein